MSKLIEKLKALTDKFQLNETDYMEVFIDNLYSKIIIPDIERIKKYKQYQKEYRLKHVEKTRLYRQSNLKKCRAKDREYYHNTKEKTKEKRKQRSKKYYHNNRDKIRASQNLKRTEEKEGK